MSREFHMRLHICLCRSHFYAVKSSSNVTCDWHSLLFSLTGNISSYNEEHTSIRVYVCVSNKCVRKMVIRISYECLEAWWPFWLFGKYWTWSPKSNTCTNLSMVRYCHWEISKWKIHFNIWLMTIKLRHVKLVWNGFLLPLNVMYRIYCVYTYFDGYLIDISANSWKLRQTKMCSTRFRLYNHHQHEG